MTDNEQELSEKLRADIHTIVSKGCRMCDYWDAENYHCMLNVPIHPAYPCPITDEILAKLKAMGYVKWDIDELRELLNCFCGESIKRYGKINREAPLYIKLKEILTKG